MILTWMWCCQVIAVLSPSLRCWRHSEQRGRIRSRQDARQRHGPHASQKDHAGAHTVSSCVHHGTVQNLEKYTTLAWHILLSLHARHAQIKEIVLFVSILLTRRWPQGFGSFGPSVCMVTLAGLSSLPEVQSSETAAALFVATVALGQLPVTSSIYVYIYIYIYIHTHICMCLYMYAYAQTPTWLPCSFLPWPEADAMRPAIFLSFID
jgi:hypothetical protein